MAKSVDAPERCYESQRGRNRKIKKDGERKREEKTARE
jgi:hypothetical protein